MRDVVRDRVLPILLGLGAVAAAGCGGDEPPRPRGRGAALGATDPDAGAARPRIVFLGDSLTAGYGLAPEQAYPARIADRLAAAGHDFEVVNAGVSGDTTSGGLRRLEWLLREPVDVLVIALGGNDALRGIPPRTVEENLQAIVDRTREAYPDAAIVLAGMRAPPNMGAAYARELEAAFAAVAQRNDLPFVPFLLEGVGGVRRLNLPDGIHPTAEGQEILAANVWDVLEEVLAGRA